LDYLLFFIDLYRLTIKLKLMKKITILFSALVLTAFGWQANAQNFNGGACPDGLAIPDNDPTGVNDTIAVTGAGTALGTDILLSEVNLHVTHTWGSDVTVTLTSPNGVTETLVTGNGGNGTQYGDDCNNLTNLSMGAATAVTAGTGNFVGSFIPQGDFNNYNDASSANGDWYVTVTDGVNGDFGNLEWIELVFAAPAVCPIPSGLLANNITTTTADLAWTENGSATTWEVVYGASGFVTGTSAIVTPTAIHNITGLMSASPYEYYVRAICGAGDTSAWSSRLPFNTSLDTASGVSCITNVPTFILTEEFDVQGTWTGDIAATATNGDWIFPFSGPTGSVSTGPNAAHSGANYVYYEASGNTTDTASLISPAIDLTLATDEAELSFWMHAYGADMSNLRVGVSNSATGPFTTLATHSGQVQTANADAWNKYGVRLDAYIGQTIFVEFNYYATGAFNADMAIDLVQVETCAIPPVCSVDLGNDTTVCSIDALTLDADTGNVSYAWDVDGVNTGDTTQMITLDTTNLGGNGTYMVVVTTTNLGNGCSATDTISVVFEDCATCSVDLGNDTTVCSINTLTLDADTGNVSYAWEIDGVNTGDTTQMITLDTTALGGNGTYMVVVTTTNLSNGCVATDTVDVTFSVCTGINLDGENVTIGVQPNPNKGVFTLNVNTTYVKELNIEVMNTQGQVVFTKNNFDNITNVNEKIDLSNNAKGIYFIKVTSDKGVKTHKVIVQ
jgi:subtilisin-like proprotein convertase family protein